MQNLTLGKKIGVGFGILIIIALVLGVVSIISMKNVEIKSTKLAYEYAPEVEMANGMERNFRLAMYNMRGYGFTGDSKFLSDAKSAIERVYFRINQAKEHVDKYPDLVKLKANLDEAKDKLSLYERLIEETIKFNKGIESTREILDSSAASYVQNCNSLLDSQNIALDKELEKQSPSKSIISDLHIKITWINDIIDIGNSIRVNNFKSQATREPEALKKTLVKFSKIDSLIDKLRPIIKNQLSLRQLDDIQKSAHNYRDAMKSFLENWLKLQELGNERDRVGQSVVKATEETARAGVSITTTYSKEAAISLSTAVNIIIIGLIIAIVLGIAIAILIARSITKPITEITKTISDANAQVVSASEQISESSISLADGASQQASSVEEVSATIEESTAINNQNAENAKEADGLAKTATESATVGNQKVQNLMKSMSDINSSSERISKIIKTIDEIAFQTNLLALNAAVEAARAGEHGLGFAVVAEEVKNLAQRSAKAARETADIIEESIEQIKQGNIIAKETNEAFGDILDKIKKSSNLIGEISISVNEQAEGMNQIAGAMSQIDQVTQQNAANSEEVAAASEELSSQAVSMLESVRVIAKMIGYELRESDSSNRHKGRKKLSSFSNSSSLKKPTSSTKTKKIEHKPKKTSQHSDSSDNPNDVFPLDEDDLKEF